MKKRKTIFVMALMAVCGVMMFMSCSKDELKEPKKFQVQSSVNANIPKFNTLDEAIELSNKLLEIESSEERAKLEHEYGYSSIGTISDDFYDIVNFDSFQSEKDFLDFYNENKWLLDTTYDDNGELCVDPKFDLNMFRYVANQDGYFYIGDTVARIFKDVVLAAHIENEKVLQDVNEENYMEYVGNEVFKYISVYKDRIMNGAARFYSVGDSKDRLVLYFQNTSKIGMDIFNLQNINHSYIIKSQHKGFCIWWAKKRNITYSYNITYSLRTSDQTWDSYVVSQDPIMEKARRIHNTLYDGYAYNGDIQCSSVTFAVSSLETGDININL